jgi:hypothetical protein
MKTISITLLSLVTLIASALCDEGQTVNKEWMVLSARAQNVAKQFELIKPGGAADPSMFKEDLEAIEGSLKKLVKCSDLVEKKLELLPPEKLGDKGFEALFEFAESISEDYGYFVALELLDIGLRRRLSVMDPNQPVSLLLRLPASQMENFLKIANDKGLLGKTTAEQGGTGQPATRPQSKSEGDDKLQPEAEGRSR